MMRVYALGVPCRKNALHLRFEATSRPNSDVLRIAPPAAQRGLAVAQKQLLDPLKLGRLVAASFYKALPSVPIARTKATDRVFAHLLDITHDPSDHFINASDQPLAFLRR